MKVKNEEYHYNYRQTFLCGAKDEGSGAPKENVTGKKKNNENKTKTGTLQEISSNIPIIAFERFYRFHHVFAFRVKGYDIRMQEQVLNLREFSVSYCRTLFYSINSNSELVFSLRSKRRFVKARSEAAHWYTRTNFELQSASNELQ